MNKKMIVSLISGATLVFTSSVLMAAPSGESIAKKGNGNGAPPCASCHGDKGQGDPAAGNPYLAGQSASYLTKQLKDYASKQRSNSVMQPMASALSADEIKSVASYYAHLPLPKTSASQKDVGTASSGKVLATKGKWSSGMPACFKCHGDKGQGVPPHFPAITGQPSAYLKNQLLSWQKGDRNNDPAGLMQAVVTHMNQSEMTAVADYLAAQSPASEK